jgi:hypothetical protein
MYVCMYVCMYVRMFVLIKMQKYSNDQSFRTDFMEYVMFCFFFLFSLPLTTVLLQRGG